MPKRGQSTRGKNLFRTPKKSNPRRTTVNFLRREFFSKSPERCARDLVGCRFHWNEMQARIVETEAYAEFDDPACHTFTRPGARKFVAAHPAGTAYVYLNYGVHWLFNILVKGPSGNGFVLLRATEPPVDPQAAPALPGAGPCAGPGKLTRVFGITGEVHGRDLFSGSTGVFSLPAKQPPSQLQITATPRIGISRGTEILWRFVLQDNPHASRRK